jgi:hypothetical protein
MLCKLTMLIIAIFSIDDGPKIKCTKKHTQRKMMQMKDHVKWKRVK